MPAKSHKPIINALHHGLIVSCQAPPDSPLHNPLVIAAMAQAAMNQGAVGVRIDTPAHIKAVRQHSPTAPIIGLWKQQLPGSEVYITPQFTMPQRSRRLVLISLRLTLHYAIALMEKLLIL